MAEGVDTVITPLKPGDVIESVPTRSESDPQIVNPNTNSEGPNFLFKVLNSNGYEASEVLAIATRYICNPVPGPHRI